MNDIDLRNEMFFEDSSQQFEEALSVRDFDTARLVLADLKEKGYDTYEMSRAMNLKMAIPSVGAYKPIGNETMERHLNSQLD